MSQKSATVAENGETTAKFGDCRTFLRQCGQTLCSLQPWWCSDKSVGLVINRLRVRLPAARCRVSTTMGTCLLTGKPSRYVSNH